AIGGVTALFALLGGSWFPIGSSGAYHDIAQFVPSYWLVQASRVSLGGSTWGALGWGVVIVWSVVLARLALSAYRRGTQPGGLGLRGGQDAGVREPDRPAGPAGWTTPAIERVVGRSPAADPLAHNTNSQVTRGIWRVRGPRGSTVLKVIGPARAGLAHWAGGD